MTQKKKQISEKTIFGLYLVITLLLLVGAVMFSVGYDNGYRIKGFSIQQVGSISMIVDEDDASVFISSDFIHETTSNEEQITIPGAEPGLQLVTVIKNRYFPWAKRVRVPSGENLTLYPFLLKQDVQAEQILPGDEDYPKVFQQFASPEKESKTRLETSLHIAEITGEGILTQSVSEPKAASLIPTIEPARELFMFKNNPNVVIYTTPTDIWVTELTEDTRLEYKIFEGEDIYLYPKGDTLFVQSANLYYQIEL